MAPGLTLALRLVVAAASDCYFVTNTRILILPTCDLSPETIEALTEDPRPSSRSAALSRPAAWAGSRNQPPWRAQPTALPGTADLRRELDDEQQRRLGEVERRLAAERQRDLALHERDEALKRLAVLRGELAAARARSGRQASRAPDARRIHAPAPPLEPEPASLERNRRATSTSVEE